MIDHSFLSTKRVLITGGLGLIGSVLGSRLAATGADVLLVDNLDAGGGGNLFNIENIRDRVTVKIADIRDATTLSEVLPDRDLIFNLAAQTSHIGSMAAPFQDLEINCQAQLTLLQACKEISPQARVIYASTRQVYGRPKYLPVNEAHPLRPVDINGVHKAAAEAYHLLYHDAYGMDTTVLRLTNVYGPHMRIKDAHQSFLGLWIRRLMQREPLEVWGGYQLRDFTFAEDAADAFLAAALTPKTIGRVLNVGGSDSVSLQNLAQLLIDQAGGESAFEICEFPLERQQIDIGDYQTDDGAFRTMTGWKAQTSLQSGLRKTLDFYRRHYDHYL
jgi:UDP-glucose 4-epimerase